MDQKLNKEKDPQRIVIDEVAGMLWAICFFPLQEMKVSLWLFLLASFLFFRIFDITKLFPASYFDKLSHSSRSYIMRGFSIVLDDVVAGIWAAIALGFCYLLWTLAL